MPNGFVRVLTGAAMTFAASLVFWQCADLGEAVPPTGSITTDQDLWTLITTREPYTGYPLFPGVDSVAAGTLNGSNAHRPLVRVSLNDTALAALVSGKLPAGGRFPGGSTIVKEIRENGHTTVLAVMHRDPGNTFAGEGWLWAEFLTDGSVLAPLTNRGSGCIGCHQREQGLGNDLIRTFERQ